MFPYGLSDRAGYNDFDIILTHLASLASTNAVPAVPYITLGVSC